MLPIIVACFSTRVQPAGYWRAFLWKLLHAYSDPRLRHILTNDGLHFWTALAANSAAFLFFSSIYCFVLWNLESKKKKSLILILVFCFTTLIAAVVIFVSAYRNPWTRTFLLGVRLVVVEIDVLLRSTTGLPSGRHDTLHNT